MRSTKADLTDTEEIPTRKISLTRIGITNMKPRNRGVVGWECTPPQSGKPYLVYLYEGMVLRTSRVLDVQSANKGLIIETLDSVYQLEYLVGDHKE